MKAEAFNNSQDGAEQDDHGRMSLDELAERIRGILVMAQAVGDRLVNSVESCNCEREAKSFLKQALPLAFCINPPRSAAEYPHYLS
jgi:hypothetical protein